MILFGLPVLAWAFLLALLSVVLIAFALLLAGRANKQLERKIEELSRSISRSNEGPMLTTLVINALIAAEKSNRESLQGRLAKKPEVLAVINPSKMSPPDPWAPWTSDPTAW